MAFGRLFHGLCKSDKVHVCASTKGWVVVTLWQSKILIYSHWRMQSSLTFVFPPALTSTSYGSPGVTRQRRPRGWSCTSPSCSATGSTPGRSSAGMKTMIAFFVRIVVIPWYIQRDCNFKRLAKRLQFDRNFCSAMMKHGVEGNPDDFTLSQLLPDKGAIYNLRAS